MTHPNARRYCKRGHDTWQVGRNNSRVCRECKRIAERAVAPTRREQIRTYTRKWRAAHPDADWNYYITVRRWRNLEGARKRVQDELAALDLQEKELRRDRTDTEREETPRDRTSEVPPQATP